MIGDQLVGPASQRVLADIPDLYDNFVGLRLMRRAVGTIPSADGDRLYFSRLRVVRPMVFNGISWSTNNTARAATNLQLKIGIYRVDPANGRALTTVDPIVAPFLHTYGTNVVSPYDSSFASTLFPAGDYLIGFMVDIAGVTTAGNFDASQVVCSARAGWAGGERTGLQLNATGLTYAGGPPASIAGWSALSGLSWASNNNQASWGWAMLVDRVAMGGS